MEGEAHVVVVAAVVCWKIYIQYKLLSPHLLLDFSSSTNLIIIIIMGWRARITTPLLLLLLSAHTTDDFPLTKSDANTTCISE